MSAATLAGLSDQLLYLAVLSYLVAVALFGAELLVRKEWLGRAGLGVTVAGLAANAGCAITRGLASGRVPWGNMYEYSVMLGAVTVAGFGVWAVRRADVRPLGAFFLIPAVLALGAGRIALYAEAGPLVPPSSPAGCASTSSPPSPARPCSPSPRSSVRSTWLPSGWSGAPSRCGPR